MLNINTKQEIVNYLKPMQIWHQNNGYLSYGELFDAVAIHLDETDVCCNGHDLDKFLKGICSLDSMNLIVQKINI